jgi:hypothetical protein
VATTIYASVAELKSRMAITVSTWDTQLADALESASREIDGHCGQRKFWLDDAVSARVYYPDRAGFTAVDDIATTVGLIVKTDTTGDGTYATTWAAADYELQPLNGIVDGETGWPYWQIKAVGAYRFPCNATRAPLQVTAKWGWAAVPGPVKQACLILAEATFKAKDAAFGVAGFDGMGVVRVRDNPMAAAKLRKYRRDPVLVG